MNDVLKPLLTLKDHPLRAALVDEMHVRRFPAFAAPARLTQIVMFTGEDHIADTRRSAEELCARFDVRPPNGRYFAVRLGKFDFVWERHTEVSTYTFISRDAFEHPFANPVLLEASADWLASLPGKVLRATQVAIMDRSSAPPDSMIESWFKPANLMSCEVQHGEARIWSDFLVHDDGMGRLLIRDQGLQSEGDTARLVQRLQELGNYRNMAMLGLPSAQEASPVLTGFEQRLTNLTRDIAGRLADDAKLLEELSGLSADLARMTAETRYRMSATRAYAHLVTDRLRELDVTRIAGHQTLTDFTERRLTPAVRTCESFSQRLEDVSQRVSWASSAMRTRIETTLERQNTSLLESMNRRAQLQLRLQQTVEGLSVLAISYYFIGILGYVTKPLSHIATIDATVVQGIAAPFVLAFVWLLIRRVRKAHEKGEH